jgi:hypothetical protein
VLIINEDFPITIFVYVIFYDSFSLLANSSFRKFMKREFCSKNNAYLDFFNEEKFRLNYHEKDILLGL